MANPPQGWKQGNKPEIYEANIKQVNISTGTLSLVAETNKTNGSYTVYNTSGINFIGGRSPIYTVSSSGARTINNPSIFNGLQSAGEIQKLDDSIKPKAFEINQTFGTQAEKDAVASSTLYKSLANSTSSDPNNPDPQSSTTPPPAPVLPTETELNPTTTEEGVGLKPTKNGRFQYPLNMDTKQDKIKFIACEIQPRNLLSSDSLAFKFPSPTYKKVGTPVYLAIQAPISDQNSVDWGPDSINAFDSALFGASYRFIKGNESGTQENTNSSSLIEKIVGTATKYQNRLQIAAAGAAAGINNILARTDGVILNPNLELLFQGPQLRPFTFQFKMSARNKDEAKEIKNIIKYFKYYMSVRKSDDELFLKSPCVFTIQYLKGENQHKSINLISPSDETKACALTNCSVDYTPLGTYMTYNDQSDSEATMVAYTLSLQFQELEPIYNTDYRDFAKNHSIGF